MSERNIQRWDEMWVANSDVVSSDVVSSDLESSEGGTPLSWEATINAALARMLEGDDAVERAIAVATA